MSDVLTILAVGLLTAAVVMTVAALVARAVGRVAVVDVAWGLGFVAIAASAAVAAQADVGQGDATRRWLLLGLVGVWGLRLAWHIRRRAVGTHGSGGGDDPR